MADNDLSLDLVLNADQAVKSVDHFAKKLKELGDPEHFKAIISNLKSVGALVAVAAAAAIAAKVAFDWTMEAEKIELVNKQFEILSKNAGIVGEELKEGLVKAAHGLVGDHELLQTANKAIVMMGESAKRLPEIMEVAARATKVMGGDIKNNFEAITEAIATGRTRALAHMGIIVDAEKAVEDFAKAHGKAANAVSETGRKQAILEQVLKNSKTAFKGVQVDSDDLITTWQKLKVTLDEVKEAFLLLFNKTIGPLVRGLTKEVYEMAHAFNVWLKGIYGSDAEKAAYKLQEIDNQLKNLEERHKGISLGMGGFYKISDEEYEKAKAAILKKKEELQAAGKVKVEAGPTTEGGAGEPGKGGFDNTQELANKAKFENDMLQLAKKRHEDELHFATTSAEVDRVFSDKKKETRAQLNADLQAIDARKDLDDDQKKALKIAREQQLHNDLKMLQEDKVRAQEDADRRCMESGKNTSDVITASVRNSAASQVKGLNGVANASKAAFGAFQNNATSALKAWGAGTKSASEAAKGFMFGMIADVAEAQGRFMMLDAFKTFPAINGPELAAGMGLVALSGLLGAMAGGSAKGVAGGEGVGGGYTAPNSDLNKDASLEAAPKRTVTVQIMGNYFETEQTRQKMLDLIRQETDATDFRYQQVRT